MGYCYEAHGSRRLVCDKCGLAGGVRKRKCAYKVIGDSHRVPSGNRPVMHYCQPPALCGLCYKQLGGLRGVHGERCRKGAAASQAEADAKQAQIDAGEMFVNAAWGQWMGTVPEGKVGLFYSGKDGDVYFLAPSERYSYPYPVFSELADVMEEWPGHPN